MEISFSEFRAKTVINLTDGRKLGHVIDLVFEQNSALIMGIVVPCGRGNMFKSKEDLFIPYQCICKIGFDTILVQLNPVTPNMNHDTHYAANFKVLSNSEQDSKKTKGRKYVLYDPESNE